MPVGEKELISLAELSRELRNRGIIQRNRRTLYHWSIAGTRFEDRVVLLKTQRIGKCYYSSVRWFLDFLAEQNLTN